MAKGRFSLANLDHLGLFCRILLMQGTLCPRCGHSTRRTSKHWGRCRKCDERVPRRTEEEVGAMLEESRCTTEGDESDE